MTMGIEEHGGCVEPGQRCPIGCHHTWRAERAPESRSAFLLIEFHLQLPRDLSKAGSTVYHYRFEITVIPH